MSNGRAIDIHCHFVTTECLERMSAVDPAWKFQREESAPESFLVHINKRKVGPMRLGGFDLGRRLREMDEAGVDIHVLSPVPYLMLYETDPETGEKLARLQNDCVAEAVRAHPDRFEALAAVPLQDPDRAIAELERATGELGMRAAALGAFLLIHPYQVAAADRLGDYAFINSLGNPIDNSIAGASLAFGGVLERLPDLKIGIVHGGGLLPYQHGRLARMIEVRPATGENLTRPVGDSLRRLHFDTLVFDAPALEYLVKTWGADHVLMGTDYPFLMSDSRPVETVNALTGIPEEDLGLIRGGNAARLLRLGD